MSEILRLEDIKKSYRIQDQQVEILKGISLAVHVGEFLAIMGPSGSGKTTLLHIMGGLDRASSGQVILDGKNVTGYSDDSLARLRNQTLGFVFQNFYLLNYYTAFDNVCVPLIYSGEVSQRKGYAKQLLKQVGLEKRWHHKPNELSGGERQRVAIARALVNRPKILFADEPTGNLDSKTGAKILDMLKDIQRQGTAVILITHDASIASHAMNVIRIEDGLLT